MPDPLDLDEIESSVRHATEVGTRIVCLECDQVRALLARVRELEKMLYDINMELLVERGERGRNDAQLPT